MYGKSNNYINYYCFVNHHCLSSNRHFMILYVPPCLSGMTESLIPTILFDLLPSSFSAFNFFIVFSPWKSAIILFVWFHFLQPWNYLTILSNLITSILILIPYFIWRTNPLSIDLHAMWVFIPSSLDLAFAFIPSIFWTPSWITTSFMLLK